jgi:hypothetical protein
MTRTSTLHTTNAGHRAMILPAPRVMSSTTLLAAIRDLETAGVISPDVAGEARAAVVNSRRFS